MSTNSVNVWLWLVGVLVLLTVVQLPAVIDTLLLFAAAGVVPGTDISLSPDQTLVVLGVFLFVSSVLIFLTEVRRALRALRLFAVHAWAWSVGYVDQRLSAIGTALGRGPAR
jgi:hypothetical protein